MKCNTKECLLKSNCYHFIAKANGDKTFTPPLVIKGNEHTCIKYITIEDERKSKINK